MGESAIVLLARAIGYPEAVPNGSSSYRFSVDGKPVYADVSNGRLVLRAEIAAAGDVDLAVFAGYASGRVMKEDAVLAYDPDSDRLILWQEISSAASDAILRRFFEVFTASCDWWRARVQGASVATSVPEMMIRP